MTLDQAKPVIDEQADVTYVPWTDGRSVGYEIRYPDGSVLYVYLSPSNGRAGAEGAADYKPNVSVYMGIYGAPIMDTPLHHYDMAD